MCMQRIMSVSFLVSGRNNSVTNKSMMAINEMLNEGWKVVNIVCANETSNGVIGGFVVLEKEETTPRERIGK